ncbi:helix-turn-helix transcriptional regulator [Streptococcus infantarius]|uniref:helix-turn-helix transcriptional regulator n=2 Tax=Streptococcus infantarius TaxID=102684 RepID=UPI00208DF320|nr:helix-turn-helix transcriptional regulator [Streptococcus infantarius]MCY7239237.1 helix-turn-helix transcriptional regulator [Streptococcus infantarius]
MHEEMVIDYTERMRREIRKDVISKHVSDCKDYIYCHVKERITVEQLASEFVISASYLSRLFKKEVGVSVSTYVKNKKIEVAKDLLKFSDYSMIEIANHLSFSSQSHFIQQFKEVVENIVIRIIMLNGIKRFGQKVTRLIVLLKLCNTHKHSM